MTKEKILEFRARYKKAERLGFSDEALTETLVKQDLPTLLKEVIRLTVENAMDGDTRAEMARYIKELKAEVALLRDLHKAQEKESLKKCQQKRGNGSEALPC